MYIVPQITKLDTRFDILVNKKSDCYTIIPLSAKITVGKLKFCNLAMILRSLMWDKLDKDVSTCQKN